MAVRICSMPGCQTTAGCKCDQVRSRPSLSDFTDEEIAKEHYLRAMLKLGDQRISVGVPSAKDPSR